MNFGAALKAVREEARLKQSEVAERADLDPSYVSMLENNKKSPTLTVYFRLCEVIGVVPSELMKRVETGTAGAAKTKARKKPSS